MKTKPVNNLDHLFQPSNFLSHIASKEKTHSVFLFVFRSICLTLRTFLNREYKFRISLDNTILELKERFAKQENLQANEITLTHVGNFFDQLDDNRTLKSYDFNSTTVLMICIRK